MAISAIGPRFNQLCNSAVSFVDDQVKKVAYVGRFLILGFPALVCYSINPLTCGTAFFLGIVHPITTKKYITDFTDVLSHNQVCSLISIIAASLVAPHFTILASSLLYCSYMGTVVKG
jgi:hypothetical protein